eukprot:1900037-Amphidinium_carterae.1
MQIPRFPDMPSLVGGDLNFHQDELSLPHELFKRGYVRLHPPEGITCQTPGSAGTSIDYVLASGGLAPQCRAARIIDHTALWKPHFALTWEMCAQPRKVKVLCRGKALPLGQPAREAAVQSRRATATDNPERVWANLLPQLVRALGGTTSHEQHRIDAPTIKEVWPDAHREHTRHKHNEYGKLMRLEAQKNQLQQVQRYLQRELPRHVNESLQIRLATPLLQWEGKVRSGAERLQHLPFADHAFGLQALVADVLQELTTEWQRLRAHQQRQERATWLSYRDSKHPSTLNPQKIARSPPTNSSPLYPFLTCVALKLQSTRALY